MCSDRAEIENLLERYCWTVDRGHWDEWLQCFTEDGGFEVRGQRIQGHAHLRAFADKEVAQAFLWVRHLLHQPTIEILGPTEARARCYLELRGATARGHDIEALGFYDDTIVKTNEGWKFKLRKGKFDYFVRRGEPWNRGGDPQ